MCFITQRKRKLSMSEGSSHLYMWHLSFYWKLQNSESKELDKGRILNCGPLGVSESLQHIWSSWTSRTLVFLLVGMFCVLLKLWIANGQESHSHAIPMGTGCNSSLAEKKTIQPLSAVTYSPSLYPSLPFCMSVLAEPF